MAKTTTKHPPVSYNCPICNKTFYFEKNKQLFFSHISYHFTKCTDQEQLNDTITKCSKISFSTISTAEKDKARNALKTVGAIRLQFLNKYKIWPLSSTNIENKDIAFVQEIINENILSLFFSRVNGVWKDEMRFINLDLFSAHKKAFLTLLQVYNQIRANPSLRTTEEIMIFKRCNDLKTGNQSLSKYFKRNFTEADLLKSAQTIAPEYILDFVIVVTALYVNNEIPFFKPSENFKSTIGLALKSQMKRLTFKYKKDFAIKGYNYLKKELKEGINKRLFDDILSSLDLSTMDVSWENINFDNGAIFIYNPYFSKGGIVPALKHTCPEAKASYNLVKDWFERSMPSVRVICSNDQIVGVIDMESLDKVISERTNPTTKKVPKPTILKENFSQKSTFANSLKAISIDEAKSLPIIKQSRYLSYLAKKQLVNTRIYYVEENNVHSNGGVKEEAFLFTVGFNQKSTTLVYESTKESRATLVFWVEMGKEHEARQCIHSFFLSEEINKREKIGSLDVSMQKSGIQGYRRVMHTSYFSWLDNIKTYFKYI